ncbi:MAG: transporter substrate-binding domain-containing protein [Bermanella sp.]
MILHTSLIRWLGLLTIKLALPLLLASSLQAQQPTLNISTFPSNGILAKSAIAIMRAAYQTIGISITIHHLPGARSIVEVNNGNMDGELFRVQGLEDKFKYLVPVKTAILNTHTSAFTFLKNTNIKNWQDLKPYSIAYVLGFKLAELNTTQSKVIHTRDLNHAFRLLINKKVEFVIDSEFNGLQIIKNQKLANIYLISPPLETTQIFHYLNFKHAHLIPKLEKALNQLKASGEAGQIREAIVKQILNSEE